MYLSEKIRRLLHAALACAVLGCENDDSVGETAADSTTVRASRRGAPTSEINAAMHRGSGAGRPSHDMVVISARLPNDTGTSRSRVGGIRVEAPIHAANSQRAGSEDSTQQQGGEGVLHRVVLAVPPERLSNARLLSDCPTVLCVGEE